MTTRPSVLLPALLATSCLSPESKTPPAQGAAPGAPPAVIEAPSESPTSVDTADASDSADPADSGHDPDTEPGTSLPSALSERPEAAFYATLSDYPCASGTDSCADTDPSEWIDGTCCAEGPALEDLTTGIGAEVVDVEVTADWVVACGGFGARVSQRRDDALAFVGEATERCQRVAFGPTTEGGEQVVYLAHHGDTWGGPPALSTWRLNGEDEPKQLGDALHETDVLYEELSWANDTLYVAAHGGGLRVYQTGADGTPTWLTTLDGFDNASALVLHGNSLYVGDATALHVIDVSTPESPVRRGQVATLGRARDLDTNGTHVWVALGGEGYQVVDVTVPTAPIISATVPTEGSVQAIDVDEDIVAAAAWTHVQIRSAVNHTLLASRLSRPRLEFEQDFGIAVVGTTVFVGEWEGVHAWRWRPGFVAGDVWLRDESIMFAGEVAETSTVTVTNRGALPARVSHAEVSDPARLSTDLGSLNLPPHHTGAVSVTWTPPYEDGRHWLTLATTDPDEDQASATLQVHVASGGGLGVGDPLPDAFRFLDPTGAEDMVNLEGKVIVLAYFALF